jgi:hypothetical protein
MMDKKDADSWMVPALKRVKGIVEASPFSSEDHQEIIDLEQDAENRSLMGLGKVVNTGVREVLNRDLIYVALNNMDFDWGCHATLVLIKDDEVVGEEVRDEAVIAGLRNKKNVWFMHKNFVVYKDKITFPQDIMKKICHFEIPWLPAEWCTVENDTFRCHSIIYANPCTPSDVFLKDQYFSGLDERGLGTILVGVKL